MKEYPKYIIVNNRVSLIHQVGGYYWRDAGHWGIQTELQEDGTVKGVGNVYSMEHMNGQIFTETTEEIWKDSNLGYV